MSFAENLKQVRKDRNLSQEELAERIEVSRQAISKWEGGMGYPEVETLLLLSQKLNVSLDRLMSVDEKEENKAGSAGFDGQITVVSPHENTITTCYKVISSQKMHGGKRAPSYALIGMSKAAGPFSGDAKVLLAGMRIGSK